MVGPSRSTDERRGATLRFRAGFVLLVGLSAGLVALSIGASTAEVLAVVGAGLLIGVVMMWWMVRSYRQIRPRS